MTLKEALDLVVAHQERYDRACKALGECYPPGVDLVQNIEDMVAAFNYLRRLTREGMAKREGLG